MLLTRAKAGLIIVGHQETLLTSTLWSSWILQAPLASLDTLQASKVSDRGQKKIKKLDKQQKKAKAR